MTDLPRRDPWPGSEHHINVEAVRDLAVLAAAHRADDTCQARPYCVGGDALTVIASRPHVRLVGLLAAALHTIADLWAELTNLRAENTRLQALCGRVLSVNEDLTDRLIAAEAALTDLGGR